MSSCAMMELSGLVNFHGRPAEAMRDFITRTSYNRAVLVSFHGVVDAPINSKTTHFWCRGCNYVQEFVAFIRKHQLGEVVEGAKAENVRNHPGHIIQACTWAPDYEAITAWSTSNPAMMKKPGFQIEVLK